MVGDFEGPKVGLILGPVPDTTTEKLQCAVLSLGSEAVTKMVCVPVPSTVLFAIEYRTSAAQLSAKTAGGNVTSTEPPTVGALSSIEAGHATVGGSASSTMIMIEHPTVVK